MARRRELEKMGEIYREHHKGYLPERVRSSRRLQHRKAQRAIGDGVGWLSRLAMAGDRLEFYTISLETLGLEHLEDETNLYRHEAVDAIKIAVLQAMPGTFWARLEAGQKGRRVHVHVLAHEAPTVVHNARPVNDLAGIALYMSKPQVPSDNLAAGILLEARRQSKLEGRQRLPKTSFSRGIPSP